MFSPPFFFRFRVYSTPSVWTLDTIYPELLLLDKTLLHLRSISLWFYEQGSCSLYLRQEDPRRLLPHSYFNVTNSGLNYTHNIYADRAFDFFGRISRINTFFKIKLKLFNFLFLFVGQV